MSVGLMIGGCGFDCAVERYFREGPDDGGGDCRERLATTNKFMEDVVVGGMADEGIDSDCFGERG